MEVRTKRLGTFAVVTRLKRENIVVTKKGGKFASAVDQRIVLTFKHGTFKANTSFALEVSEGHYYTLQNYIISAGPSYRQKFLRILLG